MQFSLGRFNIHITHRETRVEPWRLLEHFYKEEDMLNVMG